MKILRRLVILCLAAGCATSAAGGESHPSLYSFSDLYRLTVERAVGDPVGIAPASAELQQVRVASVKSASVPAEAAELRFTIAPVPGPGRWTLLLAGLAAAAWVAHRRLTRPL